METQTTTGIQHGKGDNQPVKQGGEVIMNSNNNITLTLTEASTVKKLEYVSNGADNNGTIKNAIFIIRHQPKMQNSRKYRKIHIR